MAKLKPEELKRAHKELKSDARKRIAERGVLQFRADEETVLAILKAADERQMPVGASKTDDFRERNKYGIPQRLPAPGAHPRAGRSCGAVAAHAAAAPPGEGEEF